MESFGMQQTGLLHLAPNSPDAKVFEDFAHSGHKGMLQIVHLLMLLLPIRLAGRQRQQLQLKKGVMEERERLCLLHLAPNSPDAKVFEDFAHTTASAPINVAAGLKRRFRRIFSKEPTTPLHEKMNQC